MSWKTRLDVVLGRRPSRTVRLEHDSRGLKVKIDNARIGLEEHFIEWDKVEHATAFKIDALAYDVIVLRFMTAEAAVDVTEEAQGWTDLLERLPAYLPGCMSKQQILEAVTLPPFATNATDVYSRAKS